MTDQIPGQGTNSEPSPRAPPAVYKHSQRGSAGAWPPEASLPTVRPAPRCVDTVAHLRRPREQHPWPLSQAHLSPRTWDPGPSAEGWSGLTEAPPDPAARGLLRQPRGTRWSETRTRPLGTHAAPTAGGQRETPPSLTLKHASPELVRVRSPRWAKTEPPQSPHRAPLDPGPRGLRRRRGRSRTGVGWGAVQVGRVSPRAQLGARPGGAAGRHAPRAGRAEGSRALRPLWADPDPRPVASREKGAELSSLRLTLFLSHPNGQKKNFEKQ